MNANSASRFVDQIWTDGILPTLIEYIRIPNKSPHFDPRWQEHGYMDAAVTLIEGWCRKQPLHGMRVEVVRLKDRTPVILMEIPGTGDDCVLLYGHLDKQPEMTGWQEGLGPWTPVRRGDKLYGRGGADDGYAAFASLTAIRALQEQGLPHARCVVLIEACEESGSYDLPYYIDALAKRIGKPSLVVCLDSGCGNYEQLWCTTSLRGLTNGVLRAQVLTEGVHSGDASGIVPSSFRVIRELLDRLEDANTGRVRPEMFYAEIPVQRRQQAQAAATTLGAEIHAKFPFVPGMQPMTTDLAELVLNRTWRPALAVTGADGLPALENAGNVMRPATTVKVSLRLPPTIKAEPTREALKTLFETNPPHGAKVTFTADQAATGWNAPPLDPWLERSLDEASKTFFGREAMHMGEGGTIPFMAMLGEKFPQAQFVISGVLGPHSNAHGPNEFLHIPTARKLTSCIAKVLFDHFQYGKERHPQMHTDKKAD
jgi:acetylornithine deacetylase/succinyl-diaminopimelate desuccinylase-like protein